MKKSQPNAKVLEFGREAFGRRAWGAAYSSLTAADKKSPLLAEDIERLAMAAHLIGHEAECLELLARAQQTYRLEKDLQRSARCAFWLGFISMLNGDAALASGWLARSHRLLEECGTDCVVRGYLFVPEGYRAVHSGDATRAYESFTKAVQVGEQFSDVDLVSMARQGQGRSLIRQGDIARGVSLLDEAMVAVMAGEVTPIVAGGIYCSVIESCRETFDIGRAQEWTSALEQWCASQPEMVPYRGNCLLHRAEILQLHGDWDAALTEADRAREQFEHPKPRPAIGAALYRMAELCRLRGDYAKAEKAYREASDWGQARQPGLALLRVAQGQPQVAHTMIRQLAAEVNEVATRISVLAAMIEIAIAVDDKASARTAMSELLEIAKRFEAPLIEARVTLACGEVMLAEKEFAGAQGHLRASLALWRELDAPYESARVRVLLALTCKELGDAVSAEMELRNALAVFEQLGAAPDAARVRTLLSAPENAANGPLTSRELEVLSLIASGKTNRAIAHKLNISEKTVARHVSNIFLKLDISSRAAATAYAFRHKLVPSST